MLSTRLKAECAMVVTVSCLFTGRFRRTEGMNVRVTGSPVEGKGYPFVNHSHIL